MYAEKYIKQFIQIQCILVDITTTLNYFYGIKNSMVSMNKETDQWNTDLYTIFKLDIQLTT